MVGTATAATSLWPESRRVAKVGFSFPTNAAKSEGLSSTLTPTMTSPYSANSACRREYAGKEALHGAHQDAQKSTTTTLPDVAGAAPASERAGKRLPGLTCAWDPVARSAKAANARTGTLHGRGLT